MSASGLRVSPCTGDTGTNDLGQCRGEGRSLPFEASAEADSATRRRGFGAAAVRAAATAARPRN